jgi:hypothetical protein
MATIIQHAIDENLASQLLLSIEHLFYCCKKSRCDAGKGSITLTFNKKLNRYRPPKDLASPA